VQRGKKLAPEVVEKIKVCMASGMSYIETARVNGVADSTVHTIMKRILADKDENEKFEKLKVKKKKEMEEQANSDFDKMMKASFEELFQGSVKVIKRAIDEDKLTPREAVTILGTTFDKRQVMTGGKTANVGLSFEDVLGEINKGEQY
jgi:predicted aldo/keto reductase-like oxidoreductase